MAILMESSFLHFNLVFNAWLGGQLMVDIITMTDCLALVQVFLLMVLVLTTCMFLGTIFNQILPFHSGANKYKVICSERFSQIVDAIHLTGYSSVCLRGNGESVGLNSLIKPVIIREKYFNLHR